MFGNFEEKQKEMEQKIREISIEEKSSDDAIYLKINGGFEITDLKIDLAKMDLSTSEQLEDTLIATINDALSRMQQEQAAYSQKMLSEMLPGGLEGLGGMFENFK